MKASNATSARATAPRPSGRSSARPRPTPSSAEEFALTGPSDLPDPAFHAFRKDLADTALAGRVIASHYAEPVARTVTRAAMLCAAPADEAEAIRDLAPGESFLMLDESLGWAWGYAGEELRVGYVRAEVISSST